MNISNISVIGAGSMGHQIMLVAALAGYKTVLQDVNTQSLKKGQESIYQLLNSMLSKGKISVQDVENTKSRMCFTESLEEAVMHSDLVIEAIIEKLEPKQQLFQQIERFTKPETIFATNSSTIVNSKIASVTGRPDKFVNMHFFYPALVMECVEVVMNEQTSQQTVDSVMEVCNRMGKKGFVLKKEILGFVANRLLTALTLEAMRLYEQGIADFKDIDAICKTALNHPMGPFEITDFSGGDVILFVLEQFYDETKDERYKTPKFLEQQIQEGKLGKKTGEGFYQYI